jgi:cell division protein FtsZ
MFELQELGPTGARIKVLGVGGAGGNMLNAMIAAGLEHVEFIAVNTDQQALEVCLAPRKVQIGASLTKGLGAGSKPEVGRQAALESRQEIVEALEGADMVFITAGMGGGTGTGASPVLAQAARELGALTVGVVTKPFFYEGSTRRLNAQEGIKELQRWVDTLIVIPNDRISYVVAKETPLVESFRVANDVLRQAVQGISDLVVVPGLINLDFADVRTIMAGAGRAVMGMGSSAKAREAAKRAITNPLLEDSSIEGARGILVNITGGLGLSLQDAEEAAGLVHECAHQEANIIFGAVVDADLKDEVRVTVVATGFGRPKKGQEQRRQAQDSLAELRPYSPPPPKEPTLRASARVLSKTLEGSYDIPTFMRKGA